MLLLSVMTVTHQELAVSGIERDNDSSLLVRRRRRAVFDIIPYRLDRDKDNGIKLGQDFKMAKLVCCFC